MGIENKFEANNGFFPNLMKKNWCEYKLPKNILAGLELIGTSLYNGNYKALKKEFQRTQAFENASDVLSILPSENSIQLINELINYVGNKGDEGKFIETIGKLAKENPNAEFHLNLDRNESAKKAYTKLKSQEYENVKIADTCREFRQNLLEHGGFGVVINDIQDSSGKFSLNYSINRNNLSHTDPSWNKSRYRSAYRDCTEHQHNFLAHQVFSDFPAIAISGNSFYANEIMTSKKEKNFAEKVFNYLFLAKENIETPLPGKNVSEEQRKKVERNLREFKTENELINGTFIFYAMKNNHTPFVPLPISRGFSII